MANSVIVQNGVKITNGVIIRNGTGTPPVTFNIVTEDVLDNILTEDGDEMVTE
jgi:hypothetical protein